MPSFRATLFYLIISYKQGLQSSIYQKTKDVQTFDFLGFTFYCGRSRKGMPYIMPKTSSKKFRQKIRDIKVWLYANRDQPLKKLMGMLNLKLIGHYRYYGISFNGRMISNYKQQVRELLFKVLNRRSDRKSYVLKGSTDFSVAKSGLKHGWKVYIRFDLHAKTYIIDNKRGLVGSANATNSGLSIGKSGNMEMATLVDVEPQDIEKVNKLFYDARPNYSQRVRLTN